MFSVLLFFLVKDKYGDVDGNEDMSSSSEEEDEDAEVR